MMSDFEKKFKNLTHLASQEQPPEINVAGSVLAVLATGRATPVSVSERFWMWLAAASSALAVPAAALAFFTYGSWNDPLARIFTEILWVVQ